MDVDSSKIDLDMSMFFHVLEAANLPDLAIPEVFHIFDMDNNGSISLKEFLFTLLALRPPETHIEEVDEQKLTLITISKYYVISKCSLMDLFAGRSGTIIL